VYRGGILVHKAKRPVSGDWGGGKTENRGAVPETGGGNMQVTAMAKSSTSAKRKKKKRETAPLFIRGNKVDGDESRKANKTFHHQLKNGWWGDEVIQDGLKVKL